MSWLHQWIWLCRLCRRVSELCRLGWWMIVVWRRLEVPAVSEKNWRKQLDRELARLNPVVLQLRKGVLFSSDELVDVAVVN